ncbi:hypothetical protein [Conchiformibius steedae]|nr:hypothetical protein [Conchiformibius steedae]
MTDTENRKLSAAEWKRRQLQAFRAAYQKKQAAAKWSNSSLLTTQKETK